MIYDIQFDIVCYILCYTMNDSSWSYMMICSEILYEKLWEFPIKLTQRVASYIASIWVD